MAEQIIDIITKLEDTFFVQKKTLLVFKDHCCFSLSSLCIEVWKFSPQPTKKKVVRCSNSLKDCLLGQV